MMRGAKAFSLLGILIVVVVLGLVATFVAPRFSEAGIHEARMDELCNTLQLLRSQIELYKVQHQGMSPMLTAEGTIVFDATFEQMIYCTDVDGHVKDKRPRTTRDGDWTYGPYLKGVPENPFNQSRTIVRATGREDIPVAGDAGWAYVPETGQIYANDSRSHAGL